MAIPKGIATRLFQAQKSLRGVEKTGTNKHANYEYVPVDDMIAQCRPALLDAGLLLAQGGSVVYNDDGKPTLENTYLLIDSDTGDAIEITRSTYIVSNGRNADDKAAAASDSFILTYLLRGIFMVPRVDDLAEVEEVDARNDAKVSAEEKSRIQDIIKSRIGTVVLAEQGPQDNEDLFEKAIGKRMHAIAKANDIPLSKNMSIGDLNRLADAAMKAVETSKATVKVEDDTENESE